MSDASDDCSKHVVSKRSVDGGLTWDKEWLIIASAPDQGGPGPGPVGTRVSSWVGNSVPIWDARTKSIVVVFCQNNNFVFTTRSVDQGLTYATPINITSSVKQLNWSRKDFSVFTGPAGGIQMQRGPHAGRLVVPVDVCTDPEALGLTCVGSAKAVNFALLSDNGGESWRLSSAVPPIQPEVRSKYGE